MKTLAAYKLTVTAFCEGVKKEHIEDITREDVLTYSAALRKKGCSPRTIRNRIDHLQILFHRFKIPSLLTGNDLRSTRTRRFVHTTRSNLRSCSVMQQRMSQTFSTSCYAPALGNRKLNSCAGRTST